MFDASPLQLDFLHSVIWSPLQSLFDLCQSKFSITWVQKRIKSLFIHLNGKEHSNNWLTSTIEKKNIHNYWRSSYVFYWEYNTPIFEYFYSSTINVSIFDVIPRLGRLLKNVEYF